MEGFEQQGGISFLLIFFSSTDQFYYLTFRELKVFWERRENGGRKSFTQEELNPDFYLHARDGTFIPYLDGIQKDLNLRD